MKTQISFKCVLYLVLSLTLFQAKALYAKSEILVLGDSLSAAYNMEPEQGWVSLLAGKLESCDSDILVTNLSTSGDTTQNGLSKMPTVLERQPSVLILELGGNDGLRGYPPNRIYRNLEKMIKMARDNNITVLLTGIKIPPNYGGHYTNLFYQNYRKLAQEYALPFVPFLLENVALDDNLMQSDGIHPNAKAQPQILENVWPVLQPLLSTDEGKCSL